MVNYDKKIMEPYALDVLTNTHDLKYKFYKNYKQDGFDFESLDHLNVLEVTMALPKQSKELLEYDNAYLKKGRADEKRVSRAQYYKNEFIGVNGNLKDIIDSISDSILKKETKRESRKSDNIMSYELCILSPLGYLLNEYDLIFVKEYIAIKKCGFNKIYIITSDSLYIITENEVNRKNKIFKGVYNVNKKE